MLIIISNPSSLNSLIRIRRKVRTIVYSSRVQTAVEWRGKRCVNWKFEIYYLDEENLLLKKLFYENKDEKEICKSSRKTVS